MALREWLTGSRRAALALLAAAAVDGAIVAASVGQLVPRTLFHASAALVQLALAGVLLYRPDRPLVPPSRLARAVAVSTAVVVPVAMLSRTIGIPFGPPGAMLRDTTDGPLTAAALSVLGLVVLRRARRSPPARPARRVGVVVQHARTAAAWLVALVLTSVGVLSGLSEVAAVGMAHGGQTDLTTLREPGGAEPLRSFSLTSEARAIGGRAYWTYNGTVPGPVLRVTEGDRVRVTLTNRLPVATTIHWHGVSVPNAADGVAGLTQDAVPPGATYSYEFVAREPGT